MALTDPTSAQDVSLNTDLYELTMAQAFWESGMADLEASFEVFFRSYPFQGGYALSCGSGQIADLIEQFSFNDEQLSYLASLSAPGGGKLFKSAFLNYLRDFHLRLSVWAVREGDLVFAREPMVVVQGPIIDCQLIETALLNLVNFQTLVATKAARVVQAAEGHMVSDFGLRRAQGPDGGLAVARASYVGGVSSTSNVLAGKVYGIPVFGTHAHSWVMSFPDELSAFRAFAASSPKNCVLLLDTYDVNQGIQHAIQVAHEMEEKNERLSAVRIDSGDLAKLAKKARRAFDEAGLDYVKISVSNDLDEYTIQSLFAQGAPIDSFGVGTKLATCDPQPSLGGVYKLSATRKAGSDKWQPVMKISEMSYKRTVPGLQRVIRFEDELGSPVADMIYDAESNLDASTLSGTFRMVDVVDDLSYHEFSAVRARDLLEKIVEEGHSIKESESLDVARNRAKEALMLLDPAVKRFLNPQLYPVGLDERLAELRRKLAHVEPMSRASEDVLA